MLAVVVAALAASAASVALEKLRSWQIHSDGVAGRSLFVVFVRIPGRVVAENSSAGDFEIKEVAAVGSQQAADVGSWSVVIGAAAAAVESLWIEAEVEVAGRS